MKHYHKNNRVFKLFTKWQENGSASDKRNDAQGELSQNRDVRTFG
jgi:hypothetical protein